MLWGHVRHACLKSDVAVVVDSAWEAFSVVQSKAMAVDTSRCALMWALRDHYTQVAIDMSGKVFLSCNPTACYTTRPVEKGKLVLVPLVPLAYISTTNSLNSFDSGVEVNTGSHVVRLYVSKPPQPTSAKPDDWKQDAMVIPFFWVTKADHLSMSIEQWTELWNDPQV